MSDSKVDVKSLSKQERLSLLEEIWDSLTPDDVQVTAAQRDELERRIAGMERHPDEAVSWDEARRRIRNEIQ